MSVRSRVAFASGVAGAVGAALVLSGRFDGGVPLALFLVLAVRTAAVGSLVDAGPVLAAGALRELRVRASLAAIWVFAAAAAAVRAGSSELADVRGANAVAGLALTHGSIPTVVGCWLVVAAALAALTTTVSLGAQSAAPAGAAGRIDVPVAVRRLRLAGMIAEGALLVTLFAGAQIDSARAAAGWVIGAAVAAAAVWAAPRVEATTSPRFVPATTLLAAFGLALVVFGGAP